MSNRATNLPMRSWMVLRFKSVHITGDYLISILKRALTAMSCQGFLFEALKLIYF